MNNPKAKLKKLAKLVDSLEGELDVLESSHRLQFESTASLKDKLAAAKRARAALTEARHLRELIAQALGELDE